MFQLLLPATCPYYHLKCEFGIIVPIDIVIIIAIYYYQLEYRKKVNHHQQEYIQLGLTWIVLESSKLIFDMELLSSRIDAMKGLGTELEHEYQLYLNQTD